MTIETLPKRFLEHVAQGHLLQGLQVGPARLKSRFGSADELVGIAVKTESQACAITGTDRQGVELTVQRDDARVMPQSVMVRAVLVGSIQPGQRGEISHIFSPMPRVGTGVAVPRGSGDATL